MQSKTYDIDALREFASDRQISFMEAVNKHGSVRKAALALEIHHSVVQRSLNGLKHRAALRGYSPEHDMDRKVPFGFSIRGISTKYAGDGTILEQWVKSQKELSESEEIMREFILGLADGSKFKSPKVTLPKFNDADLLAVYPMGDPHFGMLGIAAECGESFRLEDAIEQTRAAFDRLVAGAPAAETAIIAELGDFFHSDNQMNRTARSGNPLDVSTRWSEVMVAGCDTMIYCILKCLEKHKKVIVRIVRGNHDEHSSFALSIALKCYFANNPRVEVVVDPAAVWYYEFGNVLLGLTHGDTTKMGDLAGIMAVDRSEAWGRTKHRYWYQGHIHNKQVKELYGALAESFRTLAGKDAWHTAEGYRSGRDMHCIVHHKKHGEWMRSRVDIGLILEDLAERKAA